jgi:uracil-DNA glycosylase
LAGCEPSSCFRTNWFIGLLPGGKQTGVFLRQKEPRYELDCLALLRAQIKHLRPHLVLLLGTEVASRVHYLSPALAPWAGAKRWIDIDRSSIGSLARDVEIEVADVRTNFVALLHPSFGAANQKRRMANMMLPRTEAELIRSALQ